ncbi:hypothetical protein SAMN04487948_1162 [Halogranum amylolyticum]|uniref:Uncharacterized protein n=1 Tax=Halogranum amylolyticum TaxID=660520 RepID=A0A1H8VDW8_9EURY|nr:hypothetical protein [Halogranum amylolyticum]SEP13551.1 hypothetical protein SAMN04487948_1162 [Halogranum amylolyticum]
MRNSSTRLTPSQQTAFEQIEQTVEADKPFTHDTAIDCISAGDVEHPEAEAFLKQLLLKSYLY